VRVTSLGARTPRVTGSPPREGFEGKESVEEGVIPPFVQDVLSGLYYIRTRDLEVGKDYVLNANSGAKNWSSDGGANPFGFSHRLVRRDRDACQRGRRNHQQ